MRLKHALLALLLVGASCVAAAPVIAQTSPGSPSPNTGQGGGTAPGGGSQGPNGGAGPINPVPSPTAT